MLAVISETGDYSILKKASTLCGHCFPLRNVGTKEVFILEMFKLCVISLWLEWGHTLLAHPAVKITLMIWYSITFLY